MSKITIRKRPVAGASGFSADFLVERDGVLLAVCAGEQLKPTEPSIAEAEAHAAIMARAFGGETLPAGWTVVPNAAGYYVRDAGQRIVAWRRHNYLRSERITREECAALAAELKETPA